LIFSKIQPKQKLPDYRQFLPFSNPQIFMGSKKKKREKRNDYCVMSSWSLLSINWVIGFSGGTGGALCMLTIAEAKRHTGRGCIIMLTMIYLWIKLMTLQSRNGTPEIIKSNASIMKNQMSSFPIYFHLLLTSELSTQLDRQFAR
jgi:hypothetical protein